MRRATPWEQAQTALTTRHAEGRVGCTVECSHRFTGTERGLLPAPSASFQDGIDGRHVFRGDHPFTEIHGAFSVTNKRDDVPFAGQQGGKQEATCQEGGGDEGRHDAKEILEPWEGGKEAR